MLQSDSERVVLRKYSDETSKVTSLVKLAFHGADTDTDILGFLATILARMSVSVSVSASWNASFTDTVFSGLSTTLIN